MTLLAPSGLVSYLPMLVESTSRRMTEKGSFLLVKRKIGGTKTGKGIGGTKKGRWLVAPKIGWGIGWKKKMREGSKTMEAAWGLKKSAAAPFRDLEECVRKWERKWKERKLSFRGRSSVHFFSLETPKMRWLTGAVAADVLHPKWWQKLHQTLEWERLMQTSFSEASEIHRSSVRLPAECCHRDRSRFVSHASGSSPVRYVGWLQHWKEW